MMVLGDLFRLSGLSEYQNPFLSILYAKMSYNAVVFYSPITAVGRYPKVYNRQPYGRALDCAHRIGIVLFL